MSENGSTTREIDFDECSVTGCGALADAISLATVTVPANVGAVEDDFELAIALCINHARLMRMGVEVVDWASGY